MSPVFQRFKNDIMGIFWLGLSVFIALSLYSFDPLDPSFNSTGSSLEVKNLCGYFGSFLADILYQVFGLVAWVTVLASVRMAYLAFSTKDLEWRYWRLLWASSLLVTFSCLLSLYWPEQHFFGNQIFIGGGLGLLFTQGLIAAFNPIGVGVILWSMALMLVVFYTEKSLAEFAVAAKNKLTGMVSGFFSLFRRSAAAEEEAEDSENEADEELEERPSVLFRLSESFKSMKRPRFSFLNAKDTDFEEADEDSDEEFARGEHQEEEYEDEEYACADEDSEESEDGSAQKPNQKPKFKVKSMPKGFLPLNLKKKKDDDANVSSGKKRKVKLAAKVQRKIENWELPKIDLMEDPPASRLRIDEREVNMKAELLVDKLSQFSVGGEIVGVKTGPAVTMFEFKPDASVKISKITELADDLSLALSAESVRIIAPIPGRDVVGIETSNSKRETVYLKDIVAEKKFWDEDMRLPVPLGREADGSPKIVDLRKMPHLLVAGTTGSGKSVFVVSILTALLFRHSPKTLRLVLIDPKQVDLAAFDTCPHLIMPLIREPKKAVSALRWAIQEMEKRYRSMSKFGARGIEAFNEKVNDLSEEQIEQHQTMNEEMSENGQRNETYYFSEQPLIVIVVEEFGDLMAVDKSNVEQCVVRLAQMARACGIHLILAMQSPRKDVVTGLIKTNIPGRISFKVASKMDSRIILDDSGAERLLARGDMLFLAPGVPRAQRHHGPWLSEPEIDGVVDCWGDQGEPQYDDLAMAALEGSGGGFDLAGGGGDGFGGGDEEYDERYDEILAWVSGQKTVSASLIQRKFRLGYPRAARMIEVFENEGVVGPPNGSKPRQVLVGAIEA